MWPKTKPKSLLIPLELNLAIDENKVTAYIEVGQGWLTENRDEETEIATYIKAGQLWIEGLESFVFYADQAAGILMRF